MSMGNISVEDAKAVAAVLERNTSVTSIDISAHCVRDKEAKVIAAALKMNHSIKHVDLSHNLIGLKGGEALAAALQVNQSVTSMNMWMNNKAAAEAVAAVLKRNKSVTSIDVRQADMAAEGCKEIPDSGQFSNRIPFQAPIRLKRLAKALKRHDSNCTDCCFEHFNDQDVQALAEVLQVNKSISFINLQQVQMGPEGAKTVAAALRTNFVRDIDVRSTVIRDEGDRALAEALKVNKTVAFINLDSVRMGPDGAKSVAASLQGNKVIQKTILSYNPMTDEGTEALAEALKVIESATSIDLSGTSFGCPPAIRALAAALQTTRCVADIKLIGARITDDGAKALAEALRINKSVVRMDMTSNIIGPEGAKALSRRSRSIRQSRTSALYPTRWVQRAPRHSWLR